MKRNNMEMCGFQVFHMMSFNLSARNPLFRIKALLELFYSFSTYRRKTSMLEGITYNKPPFRVKVKICKWAAKGFLD